MTGTIRACAPNSSPHVLRHMVRQMTTTGAASRVAFPVGEEARSKPAWRRAFKEVLSHVPVNRIARQSAEAAETLQNLPVFQEARSISVFLSMPNTELQTTAIVLHALRTGKDVFVPFIARNPPVMDMFQLNDEQDFHSLRPDKWGIPSLNAATVNQRANCLGFKGSVAFDQEFNRLGHGKGYYDRFLTNYNNSVKQDGFSFRKPYLVGLALEEQILDSSHILPAESWDVKVDAVLVGGDFRPRVPPSN